MLAFAVATGLLLLTLGLDLGLAHRAARQAWTVPTPVPASTATAVQSTRTGYVATRPVTVVSLAALSPAPAPPPGLTVFPRPGEQWLSPALTALIEADPAVGQRWLGRTRGLVGAAALQTPDQLLVVVGLDRSSPALRAPAVRDVQRPAAAGGPVPVAGFATRAAAGADTTYRDLSWVATVLLVVPLLVLAEAAARLGLARRDARLAGLRLAGANARQVLAVTGLEAGATAAAGALLGVPCYVAAIPLVRAVPVAGGDWYARDLWVGPTVLAVALAAVVAGGACSALVALRPVLAGPLGVAQRHPSRGRQLWRLAPFGLAVGLYLRLSRDTDPSASGLVAAFGVVFLTLSLAGPWVLSVLGRMMVVTARGPARLMAGRRLVEDPRAAWRTVGGLALTGFVAGFLALFPSADGQVTWGSAQVLDVAVPAGEAAQARGAVQRALHDADLPAQVTVGTDGGALLFTTVDGPAPAAQKAPGAGATPVGAPTRRTTAYLSVPVDALDREAVRTAVTRALPGAPAATGTDITAQDDLFGADLRQASLAVLLASFVVATASAGITACGAVLDRRRTYRQLHLAGVPLGLLDQARRTETTAPLLLLVTGSLLTGLLCSAPLTRLGLGGGHLDVTGATLLAGTVLLGLVGVRTASAASRPLLRAVAIDGRPADVGALPVWWQAALAVEPVRVPAAGPLAVRVVSVGDDDLTVELRQDDADTSAPAGAGHDRP